MLRLIYELRNIACGSETPRTVSAAGRQKSYEQWPGSCQLPGALVRASLLVGRPPWVILAPRIITVAAYGHCAMLHAETAREAGGHDHGVPAGLRAGADRTSPRDHQGDRGVLSACLASHDNCRQGALKGSTISGSTMTPKPPFWAATRRVCCASINRAAVL